MPHFEEESPNPLGVPILGSYPISSHLSPGLSLACLGIHAHLIEAKCWCNPGAGCGCCEYLMCCGHVDWFDSPGPPGGKKSKNRVKIHCGVRVLG